MQTALCRFAQVCASTYGTPLISLMPAQHCAATTETPRRPTALAGPRGASRSGSLSMVTTHARFAMKVQHKLRNRVAGSFAAGSFLIGRIGAKFANLSDVARSAKRPRGDAGRDRPAGH